MALVLAKSRISHVMQFLATQARRPPQHCADLEDQHSIAQLLVSTLRMTLWLRPPWLWNGLCIQECRIFCCLCLCQVLTGESSSRCATCSGVLQRAIRAYDKIAIYSRHYSGVSHGPAARERCVMPLFWSFVKDLGECYIVGQVHGKHNVEVHTGVPGVRGWF